MIPLVDADSIVYKAASSKYDFIQVLERVHFYLDNIYNRFQSEPIIFLSGSTNFRYSVCKDYKANRKDKPRPPYFKEVREYLVDHCGAMVSVGYEADDFLGVMASFDSVICSIDKDMNTIPGNHFNYQTYEFYEVSEEQAAFYFWKQVLAGDSVDFVKGLKGIGEGKATKLLTGVPVNKMKEVVLDKFLEVFRNKKLGTEDDAKAHFDKTCRLIFIKRGSLESEYYDYY